MQLLIGSDPTTGRIVNQTVGVIDQAQIESFSGFGLECLVVDLTVFIDHHQYFILNGEVTERPASPVSRTDLTLLDVPTGSTLFINGVSYPAEGTVELDFPIGGVFQLRVECFPFLEFSDTIVV